MGPCLIVFIIFLSTLPLPFKCTFCHVACCAPTVCIPLWLVQGLLTSRALHSCSNGLPLSWIWYKDVTSFSPSPLTAIVLLWLSLFFFCCLRIGILKASSPYLPGAPPYRHYWNFNYSLPCPAKRQHFFFLLLPLGIGVRHCINSYVSPWYLTLLLITSFLGRSFFGIPSCSFTWLGGHLAF